MKSPYVNELEPNKIVTATFLVNGKDVRQKKSGEPYLSLILGDRTGELEAKMWDNVAEVVDTFDRDDFVKVKGLLQIYQNRPQITIHKMLRIDENGVDFVDYFPASKRDPDEMFAELRGIVAGVSNVHLRSLLDAFLDDEPLAKAYRTAPAAKSVHHAFLGGLLEHVLSLCVLCKFTAAHYHDIDLDLLLTGAVLHDIGKVAELTYKRSFGYSNEGQLLGHIVIGLRMLHEKLARFPDFPAPLRILVEHLLISHHGELEFGSPKIPLFPEAMLLHHLDNMDSKMECMRGLIARDGNGASQWTVYSPPLERAVLRRDRFLQSAEPLPEEVRPREEPIAEPSAIAPKPAPSGPRQSGLFAERLLGALQKD